MIDQDRDGIIGPDDLAAIYNQIGEISAVQCTLQQRMYTAYRLAIVTDPFSGPGRAIGPVCVSVCVHTITFDQNDLGSS